MGTRPRVFVAISMALSFSKWHSRLSLAGSWAGNSATPGCLFTTLHSAKARVALSLNDSFGLFIQRLKPMVAFQCIGLHLMSALLSRRSRRCHCSLECGDFSLHLQPLCVPLSLLSVQSLHGLGQSVGTLLVLSAFRLCLIQPLFKIRDFCHQHLAAHGVLRMHRRERVRMLLHRPSQLFFLRIELRYALR